MRICTSIEGLADTNVEMQPKKKKIKKKETKLYLRNHKKNRINKVKKIKFQTVVDENWKNQASSVLEQSPRCWPRSTRGYFNNNVLAFGPVTQRNMAGSFFRTLASSETGFISSEKKNRTNFTSLNTSVWRTKSTIRLKWSNKRTVKSVCYRRVWWKTRELWNRVTKMPWSFARNLANLSSFWLSLESQMEGKKWTHFGEAAVCRHLSILQSNQRTSGKTTCLALPNTT